MAFGQIATNPHDEALALLLHALGLPLDSGPQVLRKRLGREQESAARELLRRRIEERIPTAYLTREAWLGGLRFFVDERVIVPRSYFVEIIPRLGGIISPRRHGGHGDRRGPENAVTPSAISFPSDLRASVVKPALSIADVGTGSGCLAILLARRFPKARIDAIDIDPGALEVARINLRAHRLGRRVRLWRSDLFEAIPAGRYDLIVSNPPYEPTARVGALPPEFRREPRRALDGGRDGLDLIRKILGQAGDRMAPNGALLIEVGGLRRAIDREFAALRPEWIPTEDGSDCVCLIRGEALPAALR